MLGTWEILLILFIVLLLFGGRRLPELAKSLGVGIKEFKRASREITEELDPTQSSKPDDEKQS